MRFLFILSLSLLAFGCSKENKPCPDDNNCGDGLVCMKTTRTCRKRCEKPTDCGVGLLTCSIDNVCFDPMVTQCPKCNVRGGCIPSAEGCMATRDEHCAKSLNCKWYGWCSVDKDGGCIATRDEHCANSETCKEEGKCSLSPYGRDCVPSKTEHCANSEDCELTGDCSLDRFMCIPSKTEHCTKSAICKFKGRCSIGKPLGLGINACVKK